jgi:hypothetical protein
MWLVMGCGLLWLSIVAFSPFSFFLAPLGAFGILSPLARLSVWASSVTVTEEAIAAVTYAGVRKEMRWEDIRRVELVHSFVFDCSEFVRVVGGGRSFVFTDAIERYRDLMDLIDDRADQAERLPLPRIWRVLFDAGFRNKMPTRPRDADSA